jgi:hypothetical protein
MTLVDAVRPETAFLQGGQSSRSLTAPWSSGDGARSTASQYSFTLQSVGGVLFPRDCGVASCSQDRGLQWQVENGASGVLHLSEFTLSGGAVGQRLSVDAGQQLFPALTATAATDGSLVLAVLLGNGYLMHVELRTAPDAASQEPSLLAGVTSASLRPLDLSQQLAPLGAPTALCATPDGVLVGCSNGSVLVVPLSSLADGHAGRCAELRDNSWALTKLLPGSLFRPRQPAPMALLPAALAHRSLLLVLFDDGVLRTFNVGRRAQAAALELDPHAPGPAPSASAGSAVVHQRWTPLFAAAEPLARSDAGGGEAGGGTSVGLVVQWEASETLQRRTVLYSLAVSSAGRLSVAGAAGLAMDGGAAVADARLDRDTAWLLLRLPGRAQVRASARVGFWVLAEVPWLGS